MQRRRSTRKVGKGKTTHVPMTKASTVMPKRQTTISNLKSCGSMGGKSGYMMPGSSTGN